MAFRTSVTAGSHDKKLQRFCSGKKVKLDIRADRRNFLGLKEYAMQRMSGCYFRCGTPTKNYSTCKPFHYMFVDIKAASI